MSPITGMRGTGSFSASERPQTWREKILELFPNGAAPLTAFLSKMDSEKPSDPHFHWFTHVLPVMAGDVTGVYTNADLQAGNAYAGSGSAGDVLYVKMAEATAKNFVVGHQALMRDKSDPTVDCNALVTDVDLAGASSYVTVKLLEDDDNSSTGDLSDCDYIKVIGNVNAEGATMPDARMYDPDELDNYCQIFRTPLDITGTMLETELRTGKAYNRMKKQSLQMHSIEMENALLFGVKSLGTGSNGQPQRTTDGLVTAVRKYAPSNVSHYPTAHAGKAWTAEGELWLDNMFEAAFRYGGKKMCFLGSGALLGLKRLAQSGSDMQVKAGEKVYGWQLNQWDTVFGAVDLLTHPLFSQDETLRNSLLLFEPQNVVGRPLRDTRFRKDSSPDNANERAGYDGKKEEWLTEIGLEFRFPQTALFLTGVGTNG